MLLCVCVCFCILHLLFLLYFSYRVLHTWVKRCFFFFREEDASRGLAHLYAHGRTRATRGELGAAAFAYNTRETIDPSGRSFETPPKYDNPTMYVIICCLVKTLHISPRTTVGDLNLWESRPRDAAARWQSRCILEFFLRFVIMTHAFVTACRITCDVVYAQYSGLHDRFKLIARKWVISSPLL